LSNSKRRCTSCKKYKVADTGIVCAVGFFCDNDCRVVYANTKTRKLLDKSRKIENKRINKKKKAFYENDIKTRKDSAKAACHAYIKARDIGNLCICCDRPLGKNYDSGHWLESGNNPKIRYHEDNIHSQSVYCNRYKGGDSGDYEKNLRLKIGDDRVDYLLENKGGTVKRTAQDYKDIEIYYKQKVKELEKCHNL